LIKNSQPFGKNFQKTAGGIFWTHTVYLNDSYRDVGYACWTDIQK